jgi:DNA repair exonuclease SbcCD ATPase subunit
MNEETKQFIQSEFKQFRNDLAGIITTGFENIDKRFEQIDKRLDALERRLEDFELKTNENFRLLINNIEDLRNNLTPLGTSPIEVEDLYARLKYVEQKLGVESGK